ncbi:hypothetical protein T439DRAFT_379232 [Meredithblackwellia eburnea MCA 4105]
MSDEDAQMANTATSPFNDLSTELIESIFEAALDRSYNQDKAVLVALCQVSSAFLLPARRLLYRDIQIKKHSTSRKLLASLEIHRPYGDFVRSLVVKSGAYKHGTSNAEGEDIDDIIRLCPLITQLDCAYAPFATCRGTTNSRSPVKFIPSSLRHYNYTFPVGAIRDSPDDDYWTMNENRPNLLWAQDLYTLPPKLKSLKIQFDEDEDDGAESGLQQHPTTECPLKHLHTVELHWLAGITPETFNWLLAPSIQNATLRKLEIWNIPKLRKHHLQAALRQVGPFLEEFKFKPDTPAHGPLTISLLPYLTALKRLEIGPGGGHRDIYTSIASSHLTHLCLGMNNFSATLSPIAKHFLPNGRLSKVRYFELYAGVHFPPAIEVVFLDQAPDMNRPQLRELRLSHIESTYTDFQTFFSHFRYSLRALALHHIEGHSDSFWGHCSSLVQLELGVAFASPGAFGGKGPFGSYPGAAKNLRTLRIHMSSMLSMKGLLSDFEAGEFPELRVLEIAGNFPGQTPSSWTGLLMGKLCTLCAIRGIDLRFNGRTVGTGIQGWWNAIMRHQNGSDVDMSDDYEVRNLDGDTDSDSD